MSHSLTPSVTSTHSHTCARVPVLMHTHNTHTHVPQAPRIPASFLRGSHEEPPEDKASWASMPSAHGDTGSGGGGERLCRAAPGFERSCWVAQAPPLQEVQPLPSQLTPSLPQSFALRTSGRKWHLDPPSCSVFTGVQDRGLALCHGAARKKASFPWHSY